MAIFKTKLKLGDKEKVVVVINHKEGAKEKQQNVKNVDCLHHIQILDRSGSMGYEIDGLIENVKQTIDAMSDNDYVSIVWFSGPGQYKTLIKGARKDESLKTILDTIKFTIGCTCFSDPMKEVGEIIEELSPICPNFNVTLFTDGEACVPWSEEEEESKVFSEIAKYKDKVIAINTIGYRNGYNRDFLIKIASESMFGMMIHSSKINEYMSIFSHNYERISELVFESVEIKAEGAEVIYLNSSSSKLSKDSIKMSMLEKKKNQFVIISDNELSFEYDGETYNSNDITSSPKEATTDNIAYGYAYELYYLGRRQEALDILAKTINDKYFVDNQINAFTYDEVSAYSKQLRRAVFKKKHRFADGKCSSDYIPANDALCIMDVLKTLINGDNYYVYSKNYNRVGRKVEDEFNLFTYDDVEQLTAINDLVFNETELNISIRSRLTGTVKINPKVAKKNDLPSTVKSFVYRNQTIIKDGNLNMEQLITVVDKETLDKLNDFNEKVNHKLIESFEESTVNEHFKVIINLVALPIINRMYISKNGNISSVFNGTFRITELAAEQKVLNYYIKKLNEENPSLVKDKEFVQYTEEQIEVLKQHGLNKDLSYAGVENKLAEKNEDDYYLVRQLGFDIKGYASLPSCKDIIKKVEEGKKLNGPGQIMYNFIQYLKDETKDYDENDSHLLKAYYEKELKIIKKQLLSERIEINSMKMAKILTGDWFDGLVVDNKGNYNYIEDQNMLIVKTAKVKKFF